MVTICIVTAYTAAFTFMVLLSTIPFLRPFAFSALSVMNMALPLLIRFIFNWFFTELIYHMEFTSISVLTAFIISIVITVPLEYLARKLVFRIMLKKLDAADEPARA